jgi:hypothetical protein
MRFEIKNEYKDDKDKTVSSPFNYRQNKDEKENKNHHDTCFT